MLRSVVLVRASRPSHQARRDRGVQHSRSAPIRRSGYQIRGPVRSDIIAKLQIEWIACSRPVIAVPRVIREHKKWRQGKRNCNQKDQPAMRKQTHTRTTENLLTGTSFEWAEDGQSEFAAILRFPLALSRRKLTEEAASGAISRAARIVRSPLRQWWRGSWRWLPRSWEVPLSSAETIRQLPESRRDCKRWPKPDSGSSSDT